MIAAVAVLVAASGGPAESLDALVSRIAQAYGGVRAIGHIRAVREVGTLASRRGVARTLRVFAPPDRLRVEIEYPGGGGEVRVLDRDAGYRDGQPVDGPPRDAMVLQAARMDLPGLLLRDRGALVDLGAVEHEGKKLRGIGVPLGHRLNLAVMVDPASARIVRSEGALPGPGGGQVRFATDYSDFRAVQGVLFAFREANFASGQKTGETTLQKIELLDRVPAAAFRPQ